ncbi:MAG TPA: ABC transporter permease [Planctomycetaceae bacterium]|nr:ABC transporter permease [Planctomycetaceae bacterium]
MYKLLLCGRYLRTRYIALASIISVMLGVATMIVVNSVMAGFSTEMRDRIHGILADIVIESSSADGEFNPERNMARIKEVAGEYIEAMSPTVEIYGMLSFKYVGQYITRPVTLIGIDPESKSKVGTLAANLGNYNATVDKGKKIPAARTLDQPPDWELLDSYLAYRRRRVEQERWLMQHSGEEEAEAGEHNPLPFPEMEGGEAGPVNPGVFELDDADKAHAAQPEDLDQLAAPLDGRLYVGIGLISFQHDVHSKNGKSEVRTVMMVEPGDDVKISTVSAGRPPSALHFNATVVDVFKSGMSEYDSNLVFCNLEYLQDVRAMVDPTTKERAFTTIQIKLKDYKHADEVVQRLRSAFPPGLYSVRTWEQKQGPLLAAVAVESAILNVLLFLIIAVAGFGILAIFFMIVVEKTRDIGILKALGASSSGVLTIFMSYGLALGIVGSGVGVIMGLVFVWNINSIEAFITMLTGQKVFDERIYYFPTIPTHINPLMVFWVALGAMAIAVLASILPARRAARLHPVEALRYE